MSDRPLPRAFAIVAGDLVKTGGMDRANYALADYLTRSGVPVDVVAHRVAPELEQRANLSFHRVPRPLGSHMLGEPLLDQVGRRVAGRVSLRGGVTVVNGGNCSASGVNWVHYVHAAYRPRAGMDRRALVRSAYGALARQRERKALSRATLVIANSAATRRALLERFDLAPDRVFVVYLGVDATAFRPLVAETPSDRRRALGWDSRPTLAFVGGLSDERKGFDTVFAAWQTLCRRPSWDVNLVAVGAGAELEVWRARARAAGLGERVQLLGFRSDLPRVLGACDGLVAPTRYEAFGLGVAEAIAMGLPAVVSASAGVAELYPESLRHLLLKDPESPAELTRALERWRSSAASDSREIDQFSRRIRARGWDAVAADIVELVAAQGTP